MSTPLNRNQEWALRTILAEVNANGGWIWWSRDLARTRTLTSLIKRGLIQERTAPNGGTQLNMTADGMKEISRLDTLRDIPF